MPVKNNINFFTPEIIKGHNELSFFFACLENFRLTHYPEMSRKGFVDKVINKDKIRIPADIYGRYLRNKHRLTDRLYLPNFYIIPNTLFNLDISLYTLYTIYAPKS